jgi:hypothetical protein
MPLGLAVGVAMGVITAILIVVCACILVAHVVEAYTEAGPRAAAPTQGRPLTSHDAGKPARSRAG